MRKLALLLLFLSFAIPSVSAQAFPGAFGSQGFGGSDGTSFVPDIGPEINLVVSIGGVEQIGPNKTGKLTGVITVTPEDGGPTVACTIPLTQQCSSFTHNGCRDYGFTVPDPCNVGFQLTISAHMCNAGNWVFCGLYDNSTPNQTQSGWSATFCIAPGKDDFSSGPAGVFTSN